MKEERYFYVPDASSAMELPEEEMQHAVKVLRMQEGQSMYLMDGVGNFHKAYVTEVNKKHCFYRIDETVSQPNFWKGHLHIAMAPTKNIDRTEWFAEKATEIGFDQLTFLRCMFSERTVVKHERIEKILISAMKQSHKPFKPVLGEMVDFKSFINSLPAAGNQKRFICHCYDEPELGEKKLLRDVLTCADDTLILVGPEGDFSVDEVKMAEAAGFQSVSLGQSRLRTETAALVAVQMMNLWHS